MGALALFISFCGFPTFADPETGPPAPEPKSFGENVDRLHASIYDFLQRQVEHLDHWFVRKDQVALPVQPFELCLGLYGQTALDKSIPVDQKRPIDLDARIYLPNADRFLKLKVTTRDPTVIPGASPFEEKPVARVAVERSWKDAFHTTLGVKASFNPRLYTHMDWRPVWTCGLWKFYPFERVYWESGDGVGEITSLMADRWRGNLDFRTAMSLKWSAKKRDSDRQAQIRDNGWEWDANIGVNYVRELLRETDIGRVINGADLARGTGVRFGVFGGLGNINIYRLTFSQKGSLWGRWIYYVVEPEVEWNRNNNWRRMLVLRFGIEILFWQDRKGNQSHHR